MLHGLFVTGTDTGVGKTVVAAALLHRYRGPLSVCYWKPIQTGIEQDDDTAAVVRLGECQPHEVLDSGIRLPRPLSPHLAARLSGTSISVESILDKLTGDRRKALWVVEGAGGVLVPINDSEMMADMMSSLGWPVVVVARSSLGTINHTLLTLEAIRRRSLWVLGVVMVGDRNPDNRDAIQRYGRVAVLGEMPMFDPLTPERLKQWAVTELDPDFRLQAGL
ncbi:MAG: dethiobiotin synthase [Acidobacteria bacterium]|nr:dethiobiotin synthase [Acidobacteriota bacterium]